MEKCGAAVQFAISTATIVSWSRGRARQVHSLCAVRLLSDRPGSTPVSHLGLHYASFLTAWVYPGHLPRPPLCNLSCLSSPPSLTVLPCVSRLHIAELQPSEQTGRKIMCGSVLRAQPGVSIWPKPLMAWRTLAAVHLLTVGDSCSADSLGVEHLWVGLAHPPYPPWGPSSSVLAPTTLLDQVKPPTFPAHVVLRQ